MDLYLVVCTGNVCRSPMAAVYLQQKFMRYGIHHRVESCGIMALVGHPATDMAIRVAKQHGLDLQHHRAQSITPQRVDEAKQILVMEPWHRDWIVVRLPEAAGKIYLLADYIDDPALEEIPDPYGGDEQDYQWTWRLIRQAIDRWFEIQFGNRVQNAIIRSN